MRTRGFPKPLQNRSPQPPGSSWGPLLRRSWEPLVPGSGIFWSRNLETKYQELLVTYHQSTKDTPKTRELQASKLGFTLSLRQLASQPGGTPSTGGRRITETIETGRSHFGSSHLRNQARGSSRPSALRGSSLRETQAHARNPWPHRAFRPLPGGSVAASLFEFPSGGVRAELPCS